jgi:hypothetical protein
MIQKWNIKNTMANEVIVVEIAEQNEALDEIVQEIINEVPVTFVKSSSCETLEKYRKSLIVVSSNVYDQVCSMKPLKIF